MHGIGHAWVLDVQPHFAGKCHRPRDPLRFSDMRATMLAAVTHGIEKATGRIIDGPRENG